jgi:hypothetical protein
MAIPESRTRASRGPQRRKLLGFIVFLGEGFVVAVTG